MVAERYGDLRADVVWNWRKQRPCVQDRSHTPHRLQTRLTPAQESRRGLPAQDPYSCRWTISWRVVREFLNPHVSRSGLDRCLRRHGVGNLRDLKPTVPRPAHKPFKAYEPGYLHIDVKYPAANGR